MSWACSMYGGQERRGVYRALVRRPEGRRPLETPRRGREDNIKMDLQKVGWGMDWIELAQGSDRWHTLANDVFTSLLVHTI